MQDMTLKRRRDVDTLVKGNHKKGSGAKGTDLCKKCDWKGQCARDCNQEKEQRKERKVKMAREQVKAKILSRNSMATVESTVAGLKLVGRHVQRHQQRRVKEVQER